MFNHIMLGTNDTERAKKFYDATIGALGGPAGIVDPKGRLIYRHNGATLMITKPINGQPATAANGGTIGFVAASAEQGTAWHDAGVAAGGTTCEDPPGFRTPQLFLAYLRDPDGNKLCAVHRAPA